MVVECTVGPWQPEPEMRVFINALLQKIAKVEQEIDEHKAELGKVDPNDAKATKLIEGKIRDCEDTIQLHTTILGEYHKDVNQNNLAMYLPKAVCIVSHYPFYDFFRDYLSQLVWSCQNGLLLPLERYVFESARRTDPVCVQKGTLSTSPLRSRYRPQARTRSRSHLITSSCTYLARLGTTCPC